MATRENKLSVKAARLNFSGLPGMPGVEATPVAEAAPRPKTAPGAMMAYANDARSELLKENEELRLRAAEAASLKNQLGDALGDLQQWEGAKATRSIDPHLVIRSRFANRHELSFSTAEFQQLKSEIASAGGNVQPIKVRAIAAAQDAPASYEIVFGHRRHQACLELGLPVLAVVENLDDRTLFVEMDRENRARKDLSAWEQGVMYRRALKQGLFPSNRRLAEAIGVDLSALGKALALADLPEALVNAFPSPLDLQFRWAKPLADAYSAHPEVVLQRARDLAKQKGKVTAKAVFEQLSQAGTKGVEPFHPLPTCRLEVDGLAVGVIEMTPKGAITVSIDAGVVPGESLPRLGRAMEDFIRMLQKPQP
ncbi:ParB family chromosome partitioning protein [Sphaerotilus hippei]|uniref:ParB family chromosome partitioning protein n=1 Tax=Sphaerotilus hippei TaxID=744406 RepID=A0A318H2F1_9BURK|nr:ParB/RepB/Spo0J family partition protein [Sphaerotilus hippei]PXW97510.1 ParB family chromosome partitioning protein [Sphaerotilus hippei]